jgi:hypothetical protein
MVAAERRPGAEAEPDGGRDAADRGDRELETHVGRTWRRLAMHTGDALIRVQRKCAACARAGTPCTCEDEESLLTPSAVQRAPAGALPADGLADASGSSAAPLPAATRQLMERQLSAGFADVRVHDDQRAARAAVALQARAFTHGRDIYFAPGQYDPGTRAGQSLIAHELVHVVQQRNGRFPVTGASGSRVYVYPGWETATRGPLAALYRAMRDARYEAQGFGPGWQPSQLRTSDEESPQPRAALQPDRPAPTARAAHPSLLRVC